MFVVYLLLSKASADAIAAPEPCEFSAPTGSHPAASAANVPLNVVPAVFFSGGGCGGCEWRLSLSAGGSEVAAATVNVSEGEYAGEWTGGSVVCEDVEFIEESGGAVQTAAVTAAAVPAWGSWPSSAPRFSPSAGGEAPAPLTSGSTRPAPTHGLHRRSRQLARFQPDRMAPPPGIPTKNR